MDNTAVLLGANWSNGANAGSRASNWNNAPSNSNNNIGSRAVCDDNALDYLRISKRTTCGQPCCTSFGEYI